MIIFSIMRRKVDTSTLSIIIIHHLKSQSASHRVITHFLTCYQRITRVLPDIAAKQRNCHGIGLLTAWSIGSQTIQQWKMDFLQWRAGFVIHGNLPINKRAVIRQRYGNTNISRVSCIIDNTVQVIKFQYINILIAFFFKLVPRYIKTVESVIGNRSPTVSRKSSK